MFSSPSGRIACGYVNDVAIDTVRCDVQDARWPVSDAEVNNCMDGEIGDSAEIAPTGGAVLACHGDTFRGSIDVGRDGTSWVTRPGAQRGALNGEDVPVVPYGTSIRLAHGLSCTSRTTGMSCTNGVHSFTVAKEGYTFS